jgi:hypothetical protein
MKRFLVPCMTAGLLLALVSCTGSASSNHSADGPAAFLANDKSEIAFVQWRSTAHGRVEGTLSADNIGGAAPSASVSMNSVPFTGTVHGTSVNLIFAHSLFLQSHANGTLAGGSLTLAVPYADGTVHRTTFTEATRSRYNKAVAQLRDGAQQENTQATQSDSQPSANGKADQHNTQMDLASLYQASSLAPQAKLTRDLNSFARDTATARSRLATEKQDASGDNRYCAATLTVAGDSRGVNGTLLSVVGASESLTADIAAIQMDIHTTDADLRRLGRAGLTAPTAAPALIANAKASMAQATANANSYIDQSNAINNQARVLANRMATGKCSGPGQAPVAAPVARIR